jgi:hypothetical protein
LVAVLTGPLSENPPKLPLPIESTKQQLEELRSRLSLGVGQNGELYSFDQRGSNDLVVFIG